MSIIHGRNHLCLCWTLNKSGQNDYGLEFTGVSNDQRLISSFQRNRRFENTSLGYGCRFYLFNTRQSLCQ